MIYAGTPIAIRPPIMFHRFTRSLHERNPFYLLSAFSMLTGCYALSRILGLNPGQWKPVVVLMGVLQVYELVLLALAVYLLRRVKMRSDARMAFLIGLMFLVDTTYLNSELATSDPWTAPFVALAHLAFLVPKLAVVRDSLGLTSLRTLSLTVGQIGLLLYIPGTFSAVHFMDSKVHALGLGRQMLPLTVYGLWWLVGAIPLLYLWADRPSEHGENDLARTVSRVSLMLPLVSILVHLLSLHWLYDLPIHGAYVTPLLLGIGANVAYTLFDEAAAPKLVTQWGAPLLALVCSNAAPESLSFEMGELVVVTPLRLALLAISAVYWMHHSRSRQGAFVFASTFALGLALSGPSFSTMTLTWRSLFPETYGELGIAALVGAFAFLALALAVSLSKPTEDETDGFSEPRREGRAPGRFA
jgi:hypothetical protein